MPGQVAAGCTSKVKNVFCFKLDAKSVPEALATTILILQKFSIDLAHRYPGRRWAPPNRPPDPRRASGFFSIKNVFCLKIDAKSIPEALATTILILLKFSIVLAHRWNPGASAHPDPSGTPHRHPTRTPSTPWAPRRPARLLGDRL